VTIANSALPVLTPLLGDQTVEPKVDGNNGGSAEAFSTTVTTSGFLKQLTFYVDATSTATSVAVGLYTDTSGHPGTLLTQGTIAAPHAGAWGMVGVPSTTVTAGTTYWVAVLSPNGAGTVKFRNRCCGGGSPAESSSSVALSGLPATWTSGAPYRDGPLSAFGSG
jgi:hypothetical protein